MAVINGTTGNDTLAGTVDADQIFDGDGGNDTLTGGGGDDEMTVTGGADSATGGAGSDTLYVLWSDAVGDVTNSGPFGNSGGGVYGSYVIAGDRRVDYSQIENFVVTTGSGNDVIGTAGGNDTISLGAGNDIADVSIGTNLVDGGTGVDRLGISFVGSATGATINLLLIGAQQSSGPGSVTGFEGFTTVTGSEHADIFRSTDQDFDEIFSTGAGNDLVEVRNGNDDVTMGAGIDTMVVDWSQATGDVTNSGPFGNSGGGWYGVYAIAGDRRVDYSQVENFTVTTGSGNDSVSTASGDDTLSMGVGDDTANVSTGINHVDGGAGLDRLGISYAGAATGATVDLLLAGAQQSSGPGSVTGFEGFTTVIGSDHADIFRSTGQDFAEVFETGAGDDLVEVRNGDDSVTMGAGNDTLVVDWSLATGNVTNSGPFGNSGGGVYGSYVIAADRRVDYSQVETFVVTTGSGDDVIATWNGNDVVSTGTGNDMIDAGRGINVINGGAGIDALSMNFIDSLSAVVVDLNLTGAQHTSGSGAVTGIERFALLYGSAFDDIFITGTANLNDSIDGGAGNDMFVVTDGDDNIEGHSGTDTIVVQWGASSGNVTTSGPFGNSGGGLYGNFTNSDGRSLAFNRIENFHITTGSGTDSIVTGSGADIIDGGLGNDTLNGGGGIDTLVYASAAAAVTVDLSTNSVTGGGGTDIISNFENVTGSAFDDMLVGTGTANILDGGAGDDSLTGGAGDDRYIVDSGADTISELAGGGVDLVQSSATYTLSSEVEDLTLLGAAAINGTGNGSANILIGNAGDNILDGQGGDDSLTGGLGNDTYIVDSAGDTVTELAGEGIDRVQTVLASYTLGTDVERLAFTGTGSFTGTGNALANQINGGSGADSLYGLDGDDVLNGGAGADVMTGGSGNDQYVVNIAGDVVVEGVNGGIDSVSSGVSYALSANVENLTLAGTGDTNATGNGIANILTGNSGANVMNGGGGNDVLAGGGGNDVLRGGAGTDSLAGGAGDDIYYIEALGDSANEAASEGIDEVRAAVNYTLGDHIEELRLQGTAVSGVGNALDNLILGGAAANILSGLDGSDILYGYSNNDQMNGGEGDDTLFGGQGNDALFGGLGADVLRGDDNSDTVSGDAGNDTLFGGLGNDVMNGGADTDVLRGEEQNDTLNGDSGNDQLFGDAGTDTLNGGAGIDRLTGGAGKDVMTGGSERDTFAFADGDFGGATLASADQITDFSQLDDDVVNLSAVDAIAGAGNQAFAFIGTAAFGSVAGQLRYAISGGTTMVYGDTNGDAVADFAIRLDGAIALVSGDFIL